MTRPAAPSNPRPPRNRGGLLKWWDEQLAPLPAPARTVINGGIYLWSAVLTALVLHYLLCITGVLPSAASLDFTP